MSELKTIVFVYNAGGGYFNLLADAAHKIISPKTYSCRLCALTHGNFGPKKEWQAFLRSLPYPLEFLHSDEFRSRYGSHEDKLPAVYTRNGNSIELLIHADSINKCSSLEELQALIDAHVSR